jgi:tyrosyl-tRNA synthetase
MNLFEELEWRGLIKDISSPEIKNLLNKEKITFYWGTDPTADSLHIGHYSSLVTAKRLAKHGHHPILLVGGATGLIGDPRPTAEREIIDKKVIENNIDGIRNQIDKLFDGKAKLVNNYDWTKDVSFLDFLRDTGKFINVNYMLNKDIIQRRLDTGITFAEFAYTLIQGNDFLELYKNENCVLQCEGSDQWGNITTGIELIKKKLGKEAYGFTMPLILDKYGNKFGKSEGNALWLDKEKTSPYTLYQYLINQDDEMIIHYLKVFTFLTPEEIMDIEKKHKEKPEERIAQKALAAEVVRDLHGQAELDKAIEMSNALFSGDVKNLTAKDIKEVFKDMPCEKIDKEINIVDLLVDFKVCSSKREAREFVNAGTITINGDRITDLERVISKKDAIEGKYIILRRGKKKYYLFECK